MVVVNNMWTVLRNFCGGRKLWRSNHRSNSKLLATATQCRVSFLKMHFRFFPRISQKLQEFLSRVQLFVLLRRRCQHLRILRNLLLLRV